MNARINRWFFAAAFASLILGAILSRVLEPGVRVEKIMLTTNTPALRIFPATPCPHPIALLAHGDGASKEMMFRFGEALAAARFDCYSVDQAGCGESPKSCSRSNVRHYFVEAERALGEVDVFIGQSMGSGTGSWSVREAGFRPKLFVAVGNTATLGKHGPPALLLFGRFEEFGIPAQSNPQVVISPWSDHALEAFDPVLVNAAVKAACATAGKSVPAAPTAWRWRLAGLVLAIAGAFVLMFLLPELHPRMAKIRGIIVPAILLIAIILTMGTWIGVTPQLRRIPQQLVLLPVIWLALAGLGRLRLPPMEPACGYGDIDDCQWFGAFRSATCLCEEHLAFWRSHDHLRDNHGVVVTELASRQNHHLWRVEAWRRRGHDHLCELRHWTILATVLLKSESKAA